MRIRTLAGTLALAAFCGLALPAAADAGHRHSRHCRHRHGYSHGYRSDDHPHYRYDRGGRYDHRRYYRPRRHSYRGHSYYYAPPPPPRYYHYHGHRRCRRPHFSLHFGW